MLGWMNSGFWCDSFLLPFLLESVGCIVSFLLFFLLCMDAELMMMAMDMSTNMSRSGVIPGIVLIALKRSIMSGGHAYTLLL